MVLATRCPHCATAFRVAPDQLRLRGGWARCGVCNEVFDSTANLVELDEAGKPRPPEMRLAGDVVPMVLRRRGERAEALQADLPPSGSPDGVVAPAMSEPESEPDPERSVSVGESGDGFGAAPAPAAPPLPRADASVPVADETPDALPDAPAADTAAWSTAPAADGDTPSVVRARRSRTETPVDAPHRIEPEPDAPAPAPLVAEARMSGPKPPPAPGFLDEQARRRRRRAWWLWSLAALIALLVLLGQAAWVFRTELATRAPVLRPALERLCLRFACTVGYPRAPELLAIVSSSVEPWSPASPGFAPPVADDEISGQVAPAVGSSVRRLGLRVVLRNRASFAQAWPAIELSLMDLSDQVAARRILLPSVYLSPQEFSRPLAPLEERVLRIPIETLDAHATGYRVAIFYP
ncbi:hypothetical protein PIGHUM_01567 [Pigmentiphaga humi]|uniref:Zinc finger/thioredoxin putative domain-containing protein n=1 Tax=Pigmentiphaga humi TaxID=2478468 RepID=A0A3P4AZK7_9BURK|nr:zinc-ribbon and DUF3426 domain-containing protein [Pigmentiphaga humi]VCU69504.1 hypothetical protein PIGHUM_01567 [Pigmentiphaga humi]